MSERASRAFADAIRSWPFGFLYVGWTIAWWMYAGPRFGDPKPWLIWSVITTFITELDLIVYGIYQRIQSSDDTRMQRNQLDTMRLVVAIAEELRRGQETERELLDGIEDDLDSLTHPD